MGFGAIVIALSLYLFPIQENRIQKGVSSSIPSSEKKDVSIKHISSSKTINVSAGASHLKKTNNEYIIYKTEDSYRKYDIYIAAAQDLNITGGIHSDYKRIFGKIGEGKFVLKLPNAILDKKIDIVVTEKKSKKKMTIDAASMLEEMRSLAPDEEIHLIIDPFSSQKYETIVKQKSNVLPFVP